MAMNEINTRAPFKVSEWIEKFRDDLKPPICVKEIWKDGDLQVFVVGGPNSRTDYHINPKEEMFFQVQGNMVLRILEKGRPKDIAINEGELFLLPARVPHSPQRFANTIGFVQEVRRAEGELDQMLWICEKCFTPTYSEKFFNDDNEKCLPPVVERYMSDPAHKKCPKCHHQNA